MKKNIFIALFIPLAAFNSGERFLSKIEAYQRDSYFKEKVYNEHDWESFVQMAEPNKVVDPNSYDLHLLNACVFYLTNKLREEKKLPVFRYSGALRDAAVVHTDQMIEKNFFDHFNRLSLPLRTPEQRVKLFGAGDTDMAENVDYTYIQMPSNTSYLETAKKIVDDLYNSPPHKKNMLNKLYTSLGCAAIFESRDKNGVRYVKATQDFARL